jgi:hypothetical protein
LGISRKKPAPPSPPKRRIMVANKPPLLKPPTGTGGQDKYDFWLLGAEAQRNSDIKWFEQYCRDNGIKRVRTFEGTGYKEDGFTPLIYTEFEEVKLTE